MGDAFVNDESNLYVSSYWSISRNQKRSEVHYYKLLPRSLDQIEEKVAAILRPMMLLLPTPVITSLALRSAQHFCSFSAASTSSTVSYFAAAARADTSFCRRRVSADDAQFRDDQITVTHAMR